LDKKKGGEDTKPHISWVLKKGQSAQTIEERVLFHLPMVTQLGRSGERTAGQREKGVRIQNEKVMSTATTKKKNGRRKEKRKEKTAKIHRKEFIKFVEKRRGGGKGPDNSTQREEMAE